MSEQPDDRDDRPLADRRRYPELELDEPDLAEEHAPSETDPANARAQDGAPDERWDRPTEV